jgi:uncharacterized protein (TIGR03086 family)
MNEQALFILANETLAAVVARVRDDQMDLAIPPELSWRPDWTVRTAMNVYAYENACVPDVLAGKPKLPTNDEFEDDLLGDEPQASYRLLSNAANLAARALDDPERIVHISYGDFPAHQYLRDITIQRAFSAYDLAKFVGALTVLPDDLVQGLWDSLVPIVEYLRAAGVFGPEIPVPADAPLHDRLLGLTGRRP